MGKVNKYAAGAVVAAAAGYVAGILTAPKSGKETRKDIQRTALRTKREAEKRLKTLHSDLDALIEEGKSKSDQFTSAAKENWQKALATAVNAKEKAREILSAIHEGDAEDKDLEKAITEAAKAADHLKSFLSKHVQAKAK